MNHPTSLKTTTVFAPAKINLYLHVTGRKDNGYHELDSLIAFADIGDEVRITPATHFDFEVEGPFAHGFSAKEKDAGPGSSNLVVKAVWEMARATQQSPNFKVTLVKNLPMGAGIGGGSSDAAAVIWGLCEIWDIKKNSEFLKPLMLSLGADVPVCLDCQTARIQGIGESIDAGIDIPEVPILLIYPGKPCATESVFQHFSGGFETDANWPERIMNLSDLVGALRETTNSLSLAASDHVPEIENVLNVLNAAKGCVLGRMTGSGSSCFGLFEEIEDAEKAADIIREENPDWWVKTGWLGRPERY